MIAALVDPDLLADLRGAEMALRERSAPLTGALAELEPLAGAARLQAIAAARDGLVERAAVQLSRSLLERRAELAGLQVSCRWVSGTGVGRVRLLSAPASGPGALEQVPAPVWCTVCDHGVHGARGVVVAIDADGVRLSGATPELIA